MASHASHSWEAVNNHMWPDKPVRQARETSEEFLDWNTLVMPKRFINWSSKLPGPPFAPRNPGTQDLTASIFPIPRGPALSRWKGLATVG